ncbi:unnamed protein product [Protopolystoma xenopodis]|uniref:XPA C-terminal domain-containing protein n=1 Tax=Protopolystoma xenopodis TaxID=117903 RepID=A0A448XAH5_9PLAT|nr:unnamed protein product [Protopolystoma xenopodis]
MHLDPDDLHSLIARTTAKERYLLNDVDLDLREPKLRFLLKRNPHTSSWGDMRLYLEAQIAQRALDVWGSEDAIESERERRAKRKEDNRVRQYEKKIRGHYF